MPDALLAGLIFGVITAILAGTTAVDVMESAVRRGPGFAMAAGAGIATADGLWAVLTAAAGSATRRLLAPWAGLLQWSAVAVLVATLVLALRDLIRGAPLHDSGGLSGSVRHAYGDFLAQTFRHPVTAIIFGSLIMGTQPDYGLSASAAFVVGVFGASLSWQWFLVAVGARRGRTFTDRGRRGVLALDCVFLCLLIVYVAFGLYR